MFGVILKDFVMDIEICKYMSAILANAEADVHKMVAEKWAGH